ncbi:MAG TPA: hypothetical protein VIE68_03490 [Gemmatimonadota bacterium]
MSTVAVAGAQEQPDSVVPDPCAPRGIPIPVAQGLPAGEARSPAYEPLRGLDSTHDLGIGHLRAELDAGSPADTDWLRRVEVPVFADPGGEVSGWIADGWWVPNVDPGRAAPLTTETMVETGYEVASWIVEEAREGGWVRFRFAPGPGGIGWASTCHLAASDPPIAYESWEARFSGENAGPLFFRTRERHALRAGPGTGYRRSFWLPGYEGTELHPLEIRGDWMRVRVSSPPVYCAEPPPNRGIFEAGWIRWRDEEIGPWVWWFTRGC